MKKTIAFAIIAIFVFSLIPLAFAQDTTAKADSDTVAKSDASPGSGNSNVGADTRTMMRAKADARKDMMDRREDMLQKNRERLAKIKDLDQKQIERLSALNVKNVEKIEQLKKERLDRLAKLSEEKLSRISELEKDKLEKVSDLNEDELNKLAAFDRARLKKMGGKDFEKLRAELKDVRVMKVKKAEDLDERKVSDANLAQFRDKFNKAKENLKVAKEGLEISRKDLNEAIKDRNENKTIDSAKKFLSRASDALINHLEKIKTQVQESKNIPEDRVKKMVADIDAEIAAVKSIKAQAEAATTKEQLKEAAKKLREEWNKVKSLIKLHTDRLVSARVEGLVNQGLVLEKRLDSILAKAKEKGIEINVDAEVKSFSEKIGASRDTYKKAQAKISEALDLRAKGEPAESDKIKQLLKDAEDMLKQARDSLKDAHEVLKTIVKKIKEAAPDANLSEETEVEVAQETSTSASTAATGESTTTTSANTTAQAST